MNKIDIGSRTDGPGQPVLIIVEFGINHNGDPGFARELITAAFAAGADGVKFQTYRTHERFTPGNPFIDVFERCELSRDDERALWAWTRREYPDGVVLSTPFDLDSVAFLEQVGADAIKVASFEAVNLELLRAVARLRKPVLFSTGTLTETEVQQALATIQQAGAQPVPLHCVSSYPTRLEDANLAVLAELQALHDGPVGYSNHTTGVGASPYAAALGAAVIEKHFTLDQSMDGPDHEMSITPDDLGRLVVEVRHAEAMLGSPKLGPRECEQYIVDNCRRVTA